MGALLPASFVVLCSPFPLFAAPTARVSVSSSGAEGDGASGYPAISADGRCVAFAPDSCSRVS
jgi:hypothetical protein